MITAKQVYDFIWEFITKYMVWLIGAAILIIYYFFPDLIHDLGQMIIFWIPVIILIVAFLLTLGRNKFRFDRDKEQGITQYDIMVTSYEFYLTDTIIYFGTILILALGYILRKNGADVIDLLHAIIYFLATTWIKQIFYKKILK